MTYIGDLIYRDPFHVVGTRGSLKNCTFGWVCYGVTYKT